MGLNRGVAAATLTALATDGFHPAVLVFADWPSDPVRAHTGIGTISWDSQSWTGVGPFGRVEIPGEDDGQAAGEAVLTWIDTVANLIGRLGDDIAGRQVQIWVALVTEPRGTTLIGEPVEIFSGAFETRSFNIAAAGLDERAHDLVLGLRTGPSARAAARIVHSAEDQAAVSPGDTAGRHLINMLKYRDNPPTWPAT